MEILIVGAGIGGLALAALLRQRGITCSIVEKAASFDHAGYMLTLYPMGNRVLHGLHAFEAFQQASSPFRTYTVFNGEGEILHSFDLSTLNSRYGPTAQILRKDLLEVLRATAPDVPLRMGTSLENLQQAGPRVEVAFSDGSHGTFDAVIAADGKNSPTRQLLFGDAHGADTGWGLWLWWTGVEGPRDSIREFWGRGRFVGIYPTPTLTGAVAAGPRSLIGPEVVGQDGLLVRDAFSHLSGEAERVVAGFPAKTSGIFFWNLSDQRADSWTHDRVALLGDAACSFLPTVGVGASIALESAAALADELTRTDSTFLPHALALYEKRRRLRVETAQNESRKLAAWLSAESAPLVWTRDHFLKVASADALAKNISQSLDTPI